MNEARDEQADDSNPWADLGEDVASISRQGFETISKLGNLDLPRMYGPTGPTGENSQQTQGNTPNMRGSFDPRMTKAAFDQVGDAFKMFWDTFVDSMPIAPQGSEAGTEQPPTMPSGLIARVGGTVADTVTIFNHGSTDILDGRLWATDLRAPTGELIEAKQIEFQKPYLSILPPSMDVDVAFWIDVPASARAQDYYGHLFVDGLPGWRSELSLRVVERVGPAH